MEKLWISPLPARLVRGQQFLQILRLGLKNPHFGLLVIAVGDSQVEPNFAWSKEGCSCPRGRGDLRQHSIMVGVALLNDTDETFPARNIEALPSGVVPQIVGIAGALDAPQRRAVEDCHLAALGVRQKDPLRRVYPCRRLIGLVGADGASANMGQNGTESQGNTPPVFLVRSGREKSGDAGRASCRTRRLLRLA